MVSVKRQRKFGLPMRDALRKEQPMEGNVSNAGTARQKFCSVHAGRNFLSRVRY